MPLPLSGPISLDMVADFLKRPLRAVAMQDGDVRQLAQRDVPSSKISMSDFYGKDYYVEYDSSMQVATAISPGGVKYITGLTLLDSDVGDDYIYKGLVIDSLSYLIDEINFTNPSNIRYDGRFFFRVRGVLSTLDWKSIVITFPNGVSVTLNSTQLLSWGYIPAIPPVIPEGITLYQTIVYQLYLGKLWEYTTAKVKILW